MRSESVHEPYTIYMRSEQTVACNNNINSDNELFTKHYTATIYTNRKTQKYTSVLAKNTIRVSIVYVCVCVSLFHHLVWVHSFPLCF